MKNSILGKARWLRDVALATSKNNGARVAREWLKYAAMFVMLFTIGSGNVWGASVSGTYTKVTNISSLSAGDVIIIVNTAETKAIQNISTKSTKYGTLATVSATNNVITLSKADVEEFTLENGNANGQWSFKGTSNIRNNYLTWTSGNSLNKAETKNANSSWTITFNNGTATIANASTTTRLIRFNSDRFACYTTNTGTLAQIYKKGISCTTSPTVDAASNSSVTATTATVSCSGGIESVGSDGCSISSYGFVIGTSADPEIGGSGVTQHEVGTTYTSTRVSFSKDLTGLTAETTYYVRPYATNGNGTAYGTQTSFTTSALPKYTVTLEDDGDTRTQASAGASVTLPVRAGCAGYTFAGWTKTWVTDQTEWTTTAPTIIPAGSYTPTANEKLYPVYTKTEGGGEEKKTEIFATTSLGSTNTVTTGYAVSAVAEAKSGYYQDGSGDTRSVSVSKSSTATAMISSIPAIATVTAKLGGGSTKNPLTNNVYAVWLDASGNELGDAVQITSKITNTTGSDFTANLPVANATSAYGVRIKHQKETGYNVRYYAISLSITTGGSTTSYISVPNCCTSLGSVNGSF